MNPIEYESKNAVGKQKISSKYHQLVEKCNSLQVSISCVVQPIDFKKKSVMPALSFICFLLRCFI